MIKQKRVTLSGGVSYAVFAKGAAFQTIPKISDFRDCLNELFIEHIFQTFRW